MSHKYIDINYKSQELKEKKSGVLLGTEGDYRSCLRNQSANVFNTENQSAYVHVCM